MYRATDALGLAAWYRHRLECSGVVGFIATRDKPVGYLLAVAHRKPQTPFSPESGCLLVDQLAVMDRERRTGVGRALMKHAEAYACAQGLFRVELDVRAFNRDAIAFYESLGYMTVQLRMGRNLPER